MESLWSNDEFEVQFFFRLKPFSFFFFDAPLEPVKWYWRVHLFNHIIPPSINTTFAMCGSVFFFSSFLPSSSASFLNLIVHEYFVQLFENHLLLDILIYLILVFSSRIFRCIHEYREIHTDLEWNRQSKCGIRKIKRSHKMEWNEMKWNSDWQGLRNKAIGKKRISKEWEWYDEHIVNWGFISFSGHFKSMIFENYKFLIQNQKSKKIEYRNLKDSDHFLSNIDFNYTSMISHIAQCGSKRIRIIAGLCVSMKKLSQ